MLSRWSFCSWQVVGPLCVPWKPLCTPSAPITAHTCPTGLPGAAGTLQGPGEARGVVCPHGYGSRHGVQQRAGVRFQHWRRYRSEHYHWRKSVWPTKQVTQMLLQRAPGPLLSASVLETRGRPGLVCLFIFRKSDSLWPSSQSSSPPHLLWAARVTCHCWSSWRDSICSSGCCRPQRSLIWAVIKISVLFCFVFGWAKFTWRPWHLTLSKPWVLWPCFGVWGQGLG